jgi:hypothetical protein
VKKTAEGLKRFLKVLSIVSSRETLSFAELILFLFEAKK